MLDTLLVEKGKLDNLTEKESIPSQHELPGQQSNLFVCFWSCSAVRSNYTSDEFCHNCFNAISKKVISIRDPFLAFPVRPTLCPCIEWLEWALLVKARGCAAPPPLACTLQTVAPIEKRVKCVQHYDAGSQDSRGLILGHLSHSKSMLFPSCPWKCRLHWLLLAMVPIDCTRRSCLLHLPRLRGSAERFMPDHNVFILNIF